MWVNVPVQNKYFIKYKWQNIKNKLYFYTFNILTWSKYLLIYLVLVNYCLVFFEYNI